MGRASEIELGWLVSLTKKEDQLLVQEKFRELIQNSSQNTLNKALQDSALWGNDKFCEWLVKNGADINCRNEYGRTPLMQATNPFTNNVLSVLLELGADPNIQDNSGKTALWLPIENQDIERINLLLKHGASIHIPDNNKKTVLNLAIEKKRVAMVRLLLENGASPDVFFDPQTFTYQDALLRQDFKFFSGFLQSHPELEKLFVKNNWALFYEKRLGKHFFQLNCSGDKTPLFHAVEADDSLLVETLLSVGALVNFAGRCEKPITKVKSVQTYQILLSYGATLSFSEFKELLSGMVYTDNVPLLKELLKHEVAKSFDINKAPALLWRAITRYNHRLNESSLEMVKLLIQNDLNLLSNWQFLKAPNSEELRKWMHDKVRSQLEAPIYSENLEYLHQFFVAGADPTYVIDLAYDKIQNEFIIYQEKIKELARQQPEDGLFKVENSEDFLPLKHAWQESQRFFFQVMHMAYKFDESQRFSFYEPHRRYARALFKERITEKFELNANLFSKISLELLNAALAHFEPEKKINRLLSQNKKLSAEEEQELKLALLNITAVTRFAASELKKLTLTGHKKRDTYRVVRECFLNLQENKSDQIVLNVRETLFEFQDSLNNCETLEQLKEFKNNELHPFIKRFFPLQPKTLEEKFRKKTIAQEFNLVISHYYETKKSMTNEDNENNVSHQKLSQSKLLFFKDALNKELANPIAQQTFHL